MSGHVFDFAPYRLDASNARLWREDEPLSLTPKAFDVLTYLVQRGGQLVTKEELLAAVWSDALVTDASLVVCVREIRKALQDQPRAPQFIETVHRRGYRFIAEVSAADTGSEATNSAPVSLSPSDLSSTSRRHLVGRDPQLQQLHATLQQAMEGERQVVLLAGEPGSGKTMLVRAFVEQIRATEVWVSEGQCFEQFGEGEPYLPILEALTHLCQTPRCRRLIDLLTEHAPTWLRQMPSLHRQVSAEVLRREGLGSSMTRMLREIAETLEALTADTPLVLVLEDLHWSDYSTIDLLSYLANRRQPARLLILATYRPVEVILSNHALKPLRQELLARSLCSEVPLTSLDESAVAGYLRSRFPQHEIADSLASRIHRRTDGHPLFVVNLVDYLVLHAGTQPDSDRRPFADPAEVDGAIPETIRAMIDKQIERLAEQEQELLQTASVAGVEFSAAVIAAAQRCELPELEDQLDALAQRSHFLQPVDVGPWRDGTVAARFRFQHVLYRDALYARIPQGKRVRIHRQIAESTELACGDDADDAAAELAVHFEQGHIVERAIYYLRQAAQRAARRYANREACDYLTRALKLSRDAPDSPSRLALLEQRGLVYRAWNNIEGAVQDFEAMVGEARRRKRPDDEANAHFYLASTFSWIDRARCLASAEDAVALSAQLEIDLDRKHLHGWSAYWNLLWKGWDPRDAAANDDALAAAKRDGNKELICLHAGRASCFKIVRSDYLGAAQDAELGMQLALEIGDASEYLVSMVFLSWAQLFLGQWGPVSRLLWDGIQIAETNGHRRYAILLRLQLAQLCLETLDFDQALELSERTLDESRDLSLDYGHLVGPIVAGSAHNGLGQYDRAIEQFTRLQQRLDNERLLMDWFWKMPLQHGLASALLQRGDLSAAGKQATQLLETGQATDNKTYQAFAHGLLAKQAHAQGEPEIVRRELDAALQLVREHATPLAAWRILATAAEIRDDPDLQRESKTQSRDLLKQLAATLDPELPFGRSLKEANR